MAGVAARPPAAARELEATLDAAWMRGQDAGRSTRSGRSGRPARGRGARRARPPGPGRDPLTDGRRSPAGVESQAASVLAAACRTTSASSSRWSMSIGASASPACVPATAVAAAARTRGEGFDSSAAILPMGAGSPSRRTASSPATTASSSVDSSNLSTICEERSSGPSDARRQASAARMAGLGSSASSGSAGLVARVASRSCETFAERVDRGDPNSLLGIVEAGDRRSHGRRGPTQSAQRIERRDANAGVRIVIDRPDERRSGSSRPSSDPTARRPSRGRPAAVPEGHRSARRTRAGSSVIAARPGPPSRTCSPRPARSVLIRLAG